VFQIDRLIASHLFFLLFFGFIALNMIKSKLTHMYCSSVRNIYLFIIQYWFITLDFPTTNYISNIKCHLYFLYHLLEMLIWYFLIVKVITEIFTSSWIRTFELSLSWKTLTVISLEISSESKTSIFQKIDATYIVINI
jgi:hypothetical protein